MGKSKKNATAELRGIFDASATDLSSLIFNPPQPDPELSTEADQKEVKAKLIDEMTEDKHEDIPTEVSEIETEPITKRRRGRPKGTTKKRREAMDNDPNNSYNNIFIASDLKKQISISLDESCLKNIANVCDQSGLSRSEVINTIIKEFFKQTQKKETNQNA